MDKRTQCYKMKKQNDSVTFINEVTLQHFVYDGATLKMSNVTGCNLAYQMLLNNTKHTLIFSI